MEYRFASCDFETDPFLYDRHPLPFFVGVYDGASYWECWGADLVPDKFNPNWSDHRILEYRRAVADATVRAFLDHIKDWPRTIFYAHNGGKFDYHFMMDHFDGAVKIINARIVKAKLGRHQFRDSYAILPVPLRDFGGKGEIDYKKMELLIRHLHRKEISTYLQQDCVTLWDTILEFCREFSPNCPPRLTMASTAMVELNKLHKFEKMDASADLSIRPYFFGGRCQCFETGILKGSFEINDVRSMYPDAMRSIKHPVSNKFDTGTRITKNTYFLTIEAENNGAFAFRMPNGGLSFAQGVGTYNTTIHEFNAALETGTAKINKIVRTIDFAKTANFATFIDKFYGKRIVARGKGILYLVIFYKLIMNGAYGKFAQNCEDFMDYVLTRELMFEPGWEIAYEGPNYFIYERPARLRLFGYYNVATGASITGAARAKLLRGLSQAQRPIYSDTDSIICKSLPLDKSGNEIGTWELEATGNLMAIAGKKTYAMFNSAPEAIAKVRAQIQAQKKTPDYLVTIGGVKYACVKKASKGVNLTPAEIYRVAKGEIIEFPNPVPTFRLAADHRFVTRRIRRTG